MFPHGGVALEILCLHQTVIAFQCKGLCTTDTNRVFIVDIVFIGGIGTRGVAWLVGLIPLRFPPPLPVWMGRLTSGALIINHPSSVLRFQPFSAWN